MKAYIELRGHIVILRIPTDSTTLGDPCCIEVKSLVNGTIMEGPIDTWGMDEKKLAASKEIDITSEAVEDLKQLMCSLEKQKVLMEGLWQKASTFTQEKAMTTTEQPTK